MKIFVCLKHVPDTAAPVVLRSDREVEHQQVKFVINPYDEYALEQAVQLWEKDSTDEVVAVTVGPPAAGATLRKALAVGAHRAVLVETEEQLLDSRTTSQALAAAIAQEGQPDLVLTGRTAADTEGAQTPYRLAAALQLPVVNEVAALNLDADKGRALVERELGGGAREVLALPLPCALGATKGLNEPRNPKFPDIIKAKKKELKRVPLAELELTPVAGGASLVQLAPATERGAGQQATMFAGALPDQVNALVQALREQEKVI